MPSPPATSARRAGLFSSAKQLTFGPAQMPPSKTIIARFAKGRRHAGSGLEHHDDCAALATKAARRHLEHRRPRIGPEGAGARRSRGCRSARLAALRQRHASRRRAGAPRPQHQRAHREHARGGLRDAGAASGAAASRLPEPRLQLAQGDAGARERRLLRRRAGLSRVRPHRRMGQILGRRSPAVPRAQPPARPDRARLRARLSHDRDDGGPRPGFAHGRVRRDDPAGHVSPPDPDRRRLRRRPVVPVQHGERRAGAARRVHQCRAR